MDGQVTIKDIAKQLNLSLSTVSRALRNAPDVNPETRQAVMELAEALSYTPSRLALSLKQRQTRTIGVIVPNLDNVLSTMIRGIDEAALESGYTVMVCQSNESYGRELANTKRLLESLVDGVLVSVSSETKIFDHLQEILKRKLPMVQFDRSSSELKAPIVRVDNITGGFQATEHLIQQGYRRIAILAGPKNLGIGQKRMKGYFDAHKAAKRKVDRELIAHCDFSQESGYWTTLDLLSMKKRPDAIFAISDRIAIGAMLAIREKGLHMPSDIGLMGFNNEPAVQLVTPAISSVEMPSFELGKQACKLLIEKMQRHGVIPDDHEEILKTRLFVRPSSLRDPAAILTPQRS